MTLQFKKSKILIAVAFMMILTLPIITQTFQTAQALDIPTYLMVHVSPNPVGVGQTVYISLFFTKPIPTTSQQRYEELTVNVVKPDGINQTFGPFTADTTGGVGGIEFVPTVLGNYTVQGFFPGQDLVNNNTVLPSISTPVTFTVQEEQIPGFPMHSLPTEYWSRPIYATNYEWSQLGGNWWGLGKPSFTDTGGYDATGNNFNAHSKAPNAPHIMWTKPTAFGGQVGGPISGDQESQYTSTSILYRQFEPIILNGIIFYKLYPNVPTTATSPGGTPGWNAVDLRTGELLWHKETNDTLVFGWNMQFHTIQEYGTQAFLVAISSERGGTTYGNIWKLYDPMTGHFIANITNVPSTTAAGIVETRDDGTQGAVIIHAISGGNLTMWNSTRCLMSNPSASTIRPSGNINYSRGIEYSVKVVDTLNNNPIALTISGRTNDYILLREAPTVEIQTAAGYAIEAGYDAWTGEKLWGPVNRTITRFGDISRIAIGEEWYVTHDKDTNEAWVYSLKTGKQIGGTIQLPGNALSTISRGGAIAYGKCYIWDYGGFVSAIDLETATIAWTYSGPSAGYENPYGIYPLWHFGSHSIADGKLFLSESRMYDPPLFPNGHKLALNCTDGSVVWKVLGFYGREPSAIADGYLVGWNSYDCQIYTFGKGPTATTINANPAVTVQDSSIIINGKITDESAGTKDADRTARFPSGVPVVSDESMAPWMEYVYMQQPKPINATGVTVVLSVLDANGNYRQIGTTTTDIDGFYTYNWIPDIPGQYKVYANFEGSESYWSSYAVTSFAVDPAPATPTPQPTQAPSMADVYFIPMSAALLVAIIAVGITMALLMRKKP